MVVVSFWNYLEHFVQKDSNLLLSGVTDFSESYDERELLWKRNLGDNCEIVSVVS